MCTHVPNSPRYTHTTRTPHAPRSTLSKSSSITSAAAAAVDALDLDSNYYDDHPSADCKGDPKSDYKSDPKGGSGPPPDAPRRGGRGGVAAPELARALAEVSIESDRSSDEDEFGRDYWWVARSWLHQELRVLHT